ncbi:MAG: DNA polymerase IV [Gammaproteobacteria bacterium]
MRKIIHVDCDCFYAAVEMRDNPSLIGKPIAVGGSTSRRGVLSTCNYEARAFGLHSAMPTAQALKLCPDVILLPHRFDVYKEASRQVNDIYRRYTKIIQPLSLDEAYLDVSDVDLLHGSATLIAEDIRKAIEAEVGITASAGIAPNKFLAKVASDWNKPNGQFVITPDQVDDFVLQLPVKKIPGVGKSTMKKMTRLGIEYCADLQKTDIHTLIKNFGRFGKRLADLSYGIDHREVKTSRIRKSISVENTYSDDLCDEAACMTALVKLVAKFSERFAKIQDSYTIHKLFVKIKFNDFTTTTMECRATQIDAAIYEELIAQARLRKALPIRLLGVGAGVLPIKTDDAQLSLFDE